MSAQPSTMFISPTKFVKAMDEFAKENKLPYKFGKDEKILFVHVWFRGRECYQGKIYDDLQISNPLYMKIVSTHRKEIFINREQILKLFECKPVLCIRQNLYRTVPKGKDRNNMYLAFIDFVEQETSTGIRFYPVELYIEKSQNIIKTIEKQFKNDLSDKSDSDTV